MKPGVEPALVGQERRQAVRHRRVQHPLDPALGDRSQLREADLERVERNRDRLAVEVPVRDDLPAIGQHERVVGGGVQLDGDRPLGVVDRVAHGAVHLRRAAERVRVLHPPAPAMGGDDLRVVEEAVQIRRRGRLAGMRPQRLELGRERRARPAHRLDRLRGCQVGQLPQPVRAAHDERADRRHELRAVDEREALLRGELDRRQAGLRQRVGACQRLSADARRAPRRRGRARDARAAQGRRSPPATRATAPPAARRPRACRPGAAPARGARRMCPWRARSRAAAIAARTTSSGNGSPTPHAWLRTRFSWSSAACPASMCTSTSRPNPVFTP